MNKEKERQFLVDTFSKLSRKKAKRLYNYLDSRVQENGSDTRCKNLINFMHSLSNNSPAMTVADLGQLKGLVRALNEVGKMSWFSIIHFIVNAAEAVVEMKKVAAWKKAEAKERLKNLGVPNPEDPLVKQIIRPI